MYEIFIRQYPMQCIFLVFFIYLLNIFSVIWVACVFFLLTLTYHDPRSVQMFRESCWKCSTKLTRKCWFCFCGKKLPSKLPKRLQFSLKAPKIAILILLYFLYIFQVLVSTLSSHPLISQNLKFYYLLRGQFNTPFPSIS